MKPAVKVELARLHLVPEPADSMLVAFWTAAVILAAVLLYSLSTQPSWRVIGGAAILCASLFPVYLWCANKIPGVPIFPVFSLTFAGTYAYPLVSGHPIVLQYSDEACLIAGLTVALFMLVSAGTWYVSLQSPQPRLRAIRAMAPGQGDYLFCAVIGAAGLLTLIVVGDWFQVSPGVFSIIRAALFGLSSVGIFVLAYRYGKREMSSGRIAAFVFAFTLYLISQLMTLFLVSVIVAMSLAMAAFTFGRRRLPWRLALVALCLFSALHVGKAELRERYWYPEPVPMQLWHFPALLVEWTATGVERSLGPSFEGESQPLYERLSLVHLLLKVQNESPERIPYLHGETYAVIPYLLVPRILNPDKLAAHEGTTILNVHYGLQTREDTDKTTIGWGLVNEAMANFGFGGVFVLAIVMGAAYGWVTRMAVGMPVLSLPMLMAITFVAFAAQTEFTAGVYVSALFQSLVSLFGMSFVFMDRQLATGAGNEH